VIVPHTFDEVSHRYLVEGHYCLSTSDILELNCFSDYGQIPKAVLDNASWRGTEVHKAIQFFEEGELDMDSVHPEIAPYFMGYLKFKAVTGFEPVRPCENRICYLMESGGKDDVAIGTTTDLRGTINGKPYIIDVKTSYRASGMAKKQTLLKWRMQLASYREATLLDEAWWALLETDKAPCTAVVHVNKEGTWAIDKDFYDFTACEDSANWAACVRLATLKLSNGHQLRQK
jgi:hypothetical protein